MPVSINRMRNSLKTTFNLEVFNYKYVILLEQFLEISSNFDGHPLLDDIDLNTDPDLYWKRFLIEIERHEKFYYENKTFIEGKLKPPHTYHFVSHFPDIEIEPRSAELKRKIVRSAPYANQ